MVAVIKDSGAGLGVSGGHVDVQDPAVHHSFLPHRNRIAFKRCFAEGQDYIIICRQKRDCILKMFSEGQDYIIIYRQKRDRILKMFAEGQDYINADINRIAF